MNISQRTTRISGNRSKVAAIYKCAKPEAGQNIGVVTSTNIRKIVVDNKHKAEITGC